ncbi:hypothetical protein CN094_26890 [Sinorhizobium meliloti]|nr:hypothetical protein CN218_28700 [Sinorhizobium meliloti]RVL00181.1 hypothetical protein CN150_04060 [Sinorhizobium meliloti]RVN85090.1 hypothetical protein CN101_23465 [Sinorhizobium meliloti]RVO10995.1 hypothetical protein CN102_04935 [Sinorhizobium meliloti]RVO54371.1 hypothetical protein CN094_26890 [Sinorhizobium meliloti]
MTVTVTEEQREAADNLRESMRIFNNAIRMATELARSGEHSGDRDRTSVSNFCFSMIPFIAG